MKKIQHSAISVAILALIVVIVLYLNSNYKWQKEALAYLDRCYDCEFELMESTNQGGEKQFKYITADEQKIEVVVTYWWDGVYTPWGTIAVWPMRHFKDNFEENLGNIIESNMEIYVADGKSSEEVVAWIETEMNKADSICRSYGMRCPDLDIKFIYKDEVHTISCRYPVNEAILQGVLLEYGITRK